MADPVKSVHENGAGASGRRLNFLKCRQCRSDKQKCEPVDRIWPGQKCTRCCAKGWECSENLSAEQQRERERVEETGEEALEDGGKGAGLKPSSASSERAFNYYMELTLQQTALQRIVAELRKTYNEPPRGVDHAFTYLQVLHEMVRTARLYRDSMLDQACSIMELQPFGFLAFATLSLVAALPLFEDPAEFGFVAPTDDDQEKRVYERLISLWFWAQNLPGGHLGASCYLQKAILLCRLRWRSSLPLDELLERISRYEQDCRSLTRAVATVGKRRLSTPSCFEQDDHWTMKKEVAPGTPLVVTTGLVSPSAIHILLDIFQEDSPTLADCLWQLMAEESSAAEGNGLDLLGRTGLHIACSKGFDLTASRLLESGAVYDIKDSRGRTAVHWAALRGCRTFLAALSGDRATTCLLHHCDNDGETPISLAVQSYEGSKDKVSAMFTLSIIHQMWMEHEHEGCGEGQGWSILHYASAHGLTETVKALLAGEFMPYDLRASSGKTPLTVAAERGHCDVVKILCSEPTVDILSRDNLGQTALDVARGRHESVSLFLETHMGLKRQAAEPVSDAQETPALSNAGSIAQDSISYRADDNALEKVDENPRIQFLEYASYEDTMKMQVESEALGGAVATPAVLHEDTLTEEETVPPTEFWDYIVPLPLQGDSPDFLRKRSWAASIISLASRPSSTHRHPKRQRHPSRHTSVGSRVSSTRSVTSTASILSVGSAIFMVGIQSRPASLSGARNLDARFSRNYMCCGKSLPTMHDLVYHNEEAHSSENEDAESGDNQEQEICIRVQEYVELADLENKMESTTV